MKNINQIFNNNKELLSNSSVKELIDYCYELEDNKIMNEQIHNLETPLTELVRDIYLSINETIKNDEEFKRFGGTRIDYEESLINLKKYLENFSRDYRFRL